jgi:hypothetical protein
MSVIFFLLAYLTLVYRVKIKAAGKAFAFNFAGR